MRHDTISQNIIFIYTKYQILKYQLRDYYYFSSTTKLEHRNSSDVSKQRQ